MSVCAAPPQRCPLIYVCLGQTVSTQACRNTLQFGQFKSLIASAYRTPSALDYGGWEGLPAVSGFTLPKQFGLAADVLWRQACAPASDSQFSHFVDAMSCMKPSPPVVTLSAPSSFPSRSTLHSSRRCLPAMPMHAYPQEIGTCPPAPLRSFAFLRV